MTVYTDLQDRYLRLDLRICRIRRAMLRDRTRFQPNPLGEQYLTRAERWMGVIWHYESRMSALGRDLWVEV